MSRRFFLCLGRLALDRSAGQVREVAAHASERVLALAHVFDLVQTLRVAVLPCSDCYDRKRLAIASCRLVAFQAQRSERACTLRRTS